MQCPSLSSCAMLLLNQRAVQQNDNRAPARCTWGCSGRDSDARHVLQHDRAAGGQALAWGQEPFSHRCTRSRDEARAHILTRWVANIDRVAHWSGKSSGLRTARENPRAFEAKLRVRLGWPSVLPVVSSPCLLLVGC